MNAVEIVRKVLEKHKIHPNKHQSLEKCVGCTWIGWHHDEHVAQEVLKSFGLEGYTEHDIVETVMDGLIPKDDS